MTTIILTATAIEATKNNNISNTKQQHFSSCSSNSPTNQHPLKANKPEAKRGVYNFIAVFFAKQTEEKLHKKRAAANIFALLKRKLKCFESRHSFLLDLHSFAVSAQSTKKQTTIWQQQNCWQTQ